jgi:hypothetical protein
MAKKKQSLFWWCVNTILLFLPIWLLYSYEHALKNLSLDVINATDRMYLLLGVIGIFTYWIVEWVKRNENETN